MTFSSRSVDRDHARRRSRDVPPSLSTDRFRSLVDEGDVPRRFRRGSQGISSQGVREPKWRFGRKAMLSSGGSEVARSFRHRGSSSPVALPARVFPVSGRRIVGAPGPETRTPLVAARRCAESGELSTSNHEARLLARPHPARAHGEPCEAPHRAQSSDPSREEEITARARGAFHHRPRSSPFDARPVGLGREGLCTEGPFPGSA